MIRVNLINGTCISNVSTITPEGLDSLRIIENNGNINIIVLLDVEFIEYV